MSDPTLASADRNDLYNQRAYERGWKAGWNHALAHMPSGIDKGLPLPCACPVPLNRSTRIEEEW